MSGDPTLSWLSYSPWQDRFCHIYPLLRQRSDISLGLLHGEAPWQGQTLQTGLQDDEQRQVVLRGLRDIRPRHIFWGSFLLFIEHRNVLKWECNQLSFAITNSDESSLLTLAAIVWRSWPSNITDIISDIIYYIYYRCSTGGDTQEVPLTTGTTPSASPTASPGNCRRRTWTASCMALSSRLQISFGYNSYIS